MSDAIAELQIKGVQAVAIDYPMAAYYMTNNPNSTFKLDLPFASCNFGMGFRKDDTELVDKINQGLSTIKENGVYDKLITKYFPNL
jgi:polar amino acid transport system substrate-binding protein